MITTILIPHGILGPGKWYHSEGPYNEYKRQYECVLFYVDGLYRDEVTFEIEYEMTNAALRYNDCSELYLCMYSEDTIKHLKSFKGQILFPNKDMPSEENYYAHTYGTNYGSFPFIESKALNPGYYTFSFELDKSYLKFNSHNQYIEFALVSYGQDKHIFTENAPSNYYSNTNVLDELKEEHNEYEADFNKARRNKQIVLFFCCIGSSLLIVYSFTTDERIRKNYFFFEPTTKFDYFRDIPSDLDPTFASTLVFCKDKPKKDKGDGYSAIVLSLARKGYIELAKIKDEKDWTFDNVRIIIKHKPIQPQQFQEAFTDEAKKYEPLTPTEQYYFNLIARHSNGIEISMSSFQNRVSADFENTDTFVKNIENSIVNIGLTKGYFKINNYDSPKKKIKSLAKRYRTMGILLITLVNIISYQTRLDLAFGSFFILGFAFIISAIHLNKISNKYVLLTQFGEDEYAKWRGLYNFLNSETLMNERTIIELPLWEKYLVYATAFGISGKVIEALRIRCPEANMSPILSNPYYRSNSFHFHSRSFSTATHRASNVARSGGYGGYGGGYGSHIGGYGGGGRGGGGGRRRSLIHFKS